MKVLKNKNFINVLIMFFLTIIICLPMINKNLNVYYDDGIQHIARSYRYL
ncbi:MAG: hypothetical protein IKM97_02250 [Clostridia bacterium]|nr:hypothetical protein [Clostridia bacterium]